MNKHAEGTRFLSQMTNVTDGQAPYVDLNRSAVSVKTLYPADKLCVK